MSARRRGGRRRPLQHDGITTSALATALNCAVSTLTALGSKEAENGLSVPDLYAAQQTIAMLDRETGETRVATDAEKVA